MDELSQLPRVNDMAQKLDENLKPCGGI